MVRRVSLLHLFLATDGDSSTSPNHSISGILWVAEEALNSGKPSVASMSLGGGAINSVDKAVKAVCTKWMERDGDTTDERFLSLALRLRRHRRRSRRKQ